MASVKERLEAAELQIGIQGSYIMAMGEMLSEHGLLDIPAMIEKAARMTDARQRGFTEQQAKDFDSLRKKGLILPGGLPS